MLTKITNLHNLWMRICLNFGASKEDSEDIIQDMYLKVSTVVDLSKIKYGEDGVNRYYIYKMLKSLFMDLKRDKLLNNSYQLNEDIGLVDDNGYDYAKDRAIEDIVSDIKKELSTKRRSLQRLFELYYRISLNSSKVYVGEKLSYRDISDNSNISLSTVFNDMKELKNIIRFKEEDVRDYFNGDYDRIERS